MSNLKTNYKDAELSPSMNGKRQYELQYNEAGYTNLVDKTAYTEVGDTFGADDINATNSAVNELNQNLTDYSTYSVTPQKIGKWIDDSDLFRTVVEFSPTSQTNTIVSYIHNIQNIKQICKFDAFLVFTDGGTQKMPSAQFTSSGFNSTASSYISINKTEIQYMFGTNRSSQKIRVIVEYTAN